MIIAVIGSRGFKDYEKLKMILNKYQIIRIISGGAKGADTLAIKYAKEKLINYFVIKPNWKKYKKGAGLVRNKWVIEEADKVIAFWDGESKGTLFGINYAKKIKKDVSVIEV